MIRKLGAIATLLAIIFPVAIFAQESVAPKTASALVAEAHVCTGVQERMPMGMADSFQPEVGQVYLWCKITGATDPNTIIKVVWLYQGREKATVELPVKSSAWRTWSAKKILPQWTGEWEVKIVDAAGTVIKAIPFKIGAVEPTKQ
ncbi:MAG: DUF2914 domain-containing protein [candidate division Zixibacteria bacterium]|nr:DUF2914 domain-containing protein [candidate division Zixibacteria bacterium]